MDMKVQYLNVVGSLQIDLQVSAGKGLKVVILGWQILWAEDHIDKQMKQVDRKRKKVVEINKSSFHQVSWEPKRNLRVKKIYHVMWELGKACFYTLDRTN